MVGRNYAGVPDNPCRVKRIPSPIPTKQWYLRPPVVALTGGLLPFGSIFIEMYFIFTSFWNYKARARMPGGAPLWPNPLLPVHVRVVYRKLCKLYHFESILTWTCM